MRRLLNFGGLLALATLTSCKEKPAEVAVTTARELTTEDRAPKLMATSEERFRGVVRERYRYATQAGWEKRPATDMRILNFAAGEKREVEIYLSETRGDLAGNIGRWFQQFGKPAPVAEELGALPRMAFLGGEGVLVEASGSYAPGMGRPEAPGYALMGVIASTGDGVVTVKMVGPEAAVQGEKERFKAFCGSLQPGE